MSFTCCEIKIWTTWYMSSDGTMPNPPGQTGLQRIERDVIRKTGSSSTTVGLLKRKNWKRVLWSLYLSIYSFIKWELKYPLHFLFHRATVRMRLYLWKHFQFSKERFSTKIRWCISFEIQAHIFIATLPAKLHCFLHGHSL